MNDKIEKIGKGSIIQHGKLSDRVYLMKLKRDDCPDIIDEINSLARDQRYTKIFCKVPSWAAPLFTANGFIMEAQIPGFYNGKETVFFMSKFLNSDRIMNFETDQLAKFSYLLESMSGFEVVATEIKSGFSIVTLSKDNVNEASEVYREVFESYPFPIHDPKYLAKTMDENIRYFGVKKGNRLIALSSAEMDVEGANAEMTDFATLPEARGNGLAVFLLAEMEKAMKKQGIKTVYTIARLNSLAMNKTFLKQAYTYSGTLIKNTNIAGKIESMNVLYKHL